MATTRINGSEYYFEDHGPKNAPAILLSPLVFTDTSVFEPFVEALSRDFRVITYDHRGFGKSASPGSPDLDKAAADVARLVEDLQIARCHFVGNCMGAYVGLQLAIHHSDILQSCILMGVSPEDSTKEEKEQALGFLDVAKKEGMKNHAKEFADMWFGDTFKNTKDPVSVMRREKWIRHLSKLSPEQIEAARILFERPDVRKDLSKVQCPVLVLAGAEERPEALESYRKFADALPNGEFKTIPNAGYALVIEQPDSVCEHVRDFVERVEHRVRSEERRQAPRHDVGREARM